MTRRRVFRTPLLALAAAALAGASIAQDPPSPVALRQGLVGAWTGALGYRDYQSNRLFELPVQTTIEAVGDGVTLIQRSRFDDGPGKVVWITTTSLDDSAARTTVSASYRAGRPVELSTETMTVSAYVDPTHWTLVYSQTGSDDDKPAEIRVTEGRDGESLMSIKEVRPVGGDEAAWRLRNQTRLTRTGD